MIKHNEGLSEDAQRERYLEQELADAANAADAGMLDAAREHALNVSAVLHLAAGELESLLGEQRVGAAKESVPAPTTGGNVPEPEPSRPDPTTQAAEGEPEGGDEFRILPVDWTALARGGIPRLGYLDEPHIPARKRIWVVGAAGSGKSIWAAWKATQLTRAGHRVVYISQENGEEEEARRFLRLKPEFPLLRLYVDQGLDLMLVEHIAELHAVSAGAALVVLDTFTACWSGDEDSNHDLAEFDRMVMKPLQLAGSSVLVLDHTGNPQPNVRRRGVSAPRGASTKAQKTDFLLEFHAGGDRAFRLERGKARGSHGSEPRRYLVVDGDDDALELVESEVGDEEKTAEVADQLVEIVRALQPLGTTALRKAAAAEIKVGTTAVSDAIKLLKSETPPRVTVATEELGTDGGRQTVNAWRLADEPTAAQTEELW